MIKIKIKQYKYTFENLYKNQLVNSLKNVEKLVINENSKVFSFSLNKIDFYFSKDVMFIENNNDVLCGRIQENEYNHIYLSYMTLNNKFDEYPKRSLLSFEEFKKFSFHIDVEYDNSIKVIPYIIHYKEQKKYKLTKIENNTQIINFSKDEKCRLTFKILGYGKFKIKRISAIPKG